MRYQMNLINKIFVIVQLLCYIRRLLHVLLKRFVFSTHLSLIGPLHVLVKMFIY